MATLVCPGCSEQIDVTDCKPGSKVYCAGCGRALSVETKLVDAKSAQDAITKARERMKGATKKLRCPNCDTDLRVRPEDTQAGASFRCMECGQKIVMQQKPGTSGSGTVTFPALGSDGTLLDMGDLREAWPEKPPPPAPKKPKK